MQIQRLARSDDDTILFTIVGDQPKQQTIHARFAAAGPHF
jgi:hypothetical protein